MNKISLFGHGFVGREYTKQFPDTVVVERGAMYAPTENILYGISTVHNYHPKEGDLFVDVDTNLTHFLGVLQANQDRDITFNLISSWFVYGSTDMPAREDSECNPTGFYSITARARELLLISYAETFGMKYRILRLGNVIGIGDEKVSRKKNATQWMVRELAQGREVKVYKGGAVRDFIDVRDCAKAINLVLEKGELNSIYNISNGQGLNIFDLMNTANREAKFRGTVGEMETPSFHKTVQVPKMFLDTKKLKNLGYVQTYDIKQSIRELVHHYE
jgi:dTDP-glucose 4,6-dehydratase